MKHRLRYNFGPAQRPLDTCCADCSCAESSCRSLFLPRRDHRRVTSTVIAIGARMAALWIGARLVCGMIARVLPTKRYGPAPIGLAIMAVPIISHVTTATRQPVRGIHTLRAIGPTNRRTARHSAECRTVLRNTDRYHMAMHQLPAHITRRGCGEISAFIGRP